MIYIVNIKSIKYFHNYNYNIKKIKEEIFH